MLRAAGRAVPADRGHEHQRRSPGPGSPTTSTCSSGPTRPARAARRSTAAGFDTEEKDPYWLYKAFKHGVLVDVIFRSSGDLYLDDEMLARGRRREYLGVTAPLVSPGGPAGHQGGGRGRARPHHWYDALAVIGRCQLDWDYLLAPGPPRPGPGGCSACCSTPSRTTWPCRPRSSRTCSRWSTRRPGPGEVRHRERRRRPAAARVPGRATSRTPWRRRPACPRAGRRRGRGRLARVVLTGTVATAAQRRAIGEVVCELVDCEAPAATTVVNELGGRRPPTRAARWRSWRDPHRRRRRHPRRGRLGRAGGRRACAHVTERADVLLLAGDLTRCGTAAEAELVADELAGGRRPGRGRAGQPRLPRRRGRRGGPRCWSAAGVTVLDGTSTTVVEAGGDRRRHRRGQGLRRRVRRGLRHRVRRAGHEGVHRRDPSARRPRLHDALVGRGQPTTGRSRCSTTRRWRRPCGGERPGDLPVPRQLPAGRGHRHRRRRPGRSTATPTRAASGA